MLAVKNLDGWTILLRVAFAALFGYFSFVVITSLAKLQASRVSG